MMQHYPAKEAINRINTFAKNKQPFLFIINYDTTKSYIQPLSKIDPNHLCYDFNGKTNTPKQGGLHQSPNVTPKWEATHLSFNKYQQHFSPLISALQQGNISLANLTFPTSIKTNLSLKALYQQAQAKYRLWLADQDHHFTFFSPETFITIDAGILRTFPMKGTIDATLQDAENQLLNNPKEIDEHKIAVELTIADLAKVVSNININRYRYLDRVETNSGPILQSSSEVYGQLPSNYIETLGEIIFSLLPAVSITGGPPKPLALQIINECEQYDRGFYTGVSGIFDGHAIDSTVMIRFIEQHGQDFYFKSGGGITAQSDIQAEYEELKRKIYVPIY